MYELGGIKYVYDPEEAIAANGFYLCPYCEGRWYAGSSHPLHREECVNVEEGRDLEYHFGEGLVAVVKRRAVNRGRQARWHGLSLDMLTQHFPEALR